MNVQHKLEGFSKAAIKEAEDMRKRVLDSKKAELEAQSNDVIKKAELKAQGRVKHEKSIVEQYINKGIISAQTEAKRGLIQVRTELSDKVIDNVITKIEEFKKTPEYVDYLLDEINKSIKEFGSDILILLSSSDGHLKETLKQKVSVEIGVDKIDFVGGFRLFINKTKISVDNSLETKISAARLAFNYLKIIE